MKSVRTRTVDIIWEKVDSKFEQLEPYFMLALIATFAIVMSISIGVGLWKMVSLFL